jgi:hypothetical protein
LIECLWLWEHNFKLTQINILLIISIPVPIFWLIAADGNLIYYIVGGFSLIFVIIGILSEYKSEKHKDDP